MPRDKCYEKNKAGRKGDKGKTRGLNKMRKQTSSLGKSLPGGRKTRTKTLEEDFTWCVRGTKRQSW